MTDLPQSLIASGPNDLSGFGRRTFVMGHNFAPLPMFSDDGIAGLLDRHPREDLYVMTMGSDPARPDWRHGDPGALSGAELLEAVRRGRLWLNVKRVGIHHADYRDLIARLYGELEEKVPGFHPIWTAGTMLVSSPGAMVFYHLDAPSNMLWHIRGEKRVWVYPGEDERFVPAESLSRIMAGEADEGLDYDPSFDASAAVIDLHPGEVATWPQNAPHRIVNGDSLNISLSTEHLTPRMRRRINVFRANRLLNGSFGLPARSVATEGAAARAKEILYYGVRTAQKLAGKRQVGYVEPMSFRVDLTAPDCIAAFSGRDG
ncbi:MAG: hypothetical protein AB7K86_17800 [Rhodospirillales bacterium]